MPGDQTQRKLECITNPPEVFYNDPKSRTFEVVIVCSGQSAPEIDPNGFTPVTVSLLYERGELVDDQTILEHISNPGQIQMNRKVAFRFRISQVSRSHLNRRFKLRFTLKDDSDQDVHVETTSVHVFSKMASKRSRGKKTVDGRESVSKKICFTTAVEKKWIEDSCKLMQAIAWTRVGYEMKLSEAGEEVMDTQRPIYRCVCCNAMATTTTGCSKAHQANCKLSALLDAQKKSSKPPLKVNPPLKVKEEEYPSELPIPQYGATQQTHEAADTDYEELQGQLDSLLGGKEFDDEDLWIAGDTLKEVFADSPTPGNDENSNSNISALPML
jgi:hypothetical protein